MRSKILILTAVLTLSAATYAALGCGDAPISRPSAVIVKEIVNPGTRCSRQYYHGPFKSARAANKWIEEREARPVAPGKIASEYVVANLYTP